MKLKVLFLMTFFAVINLSAQGNRFIYEYQSRRDSTRTDSLKKEFVNLDIFPGKSYFYGQAKFASDSADNVSIAQQRIATPGNYSITSTIYDWNIEYVVEKSFPEFKINWFTSLQRTDLNVEEKTEIKWNILPVTAKIENYNCQKATTKFGGRTWEAWFSKDLPFPDGPYKFHGLPGLIVKMEDHTKSHSYILKGNKKLGKKDHSWDYILSLRKEAENNVKSVKVSQEQYKKLYQSYKNDPAKDIKQKLSSPNTRMEVSFGDGRIIKDNAEIIKYYEESLGEVFKRNNNHLELSLHKK
ncbi:GLPGLI family protein [Chryseobacterium caseinilyticum]|uniref:GLPGLI family protein n=1 Tax=Chryseobacterium caseinilyticum TaxID=2771428 RepID=A0ABR8ZD75_9FLAO|nr:GLPGLI family protein [Chryseobacterium caseinilyticum]MBD8083205.1 GLPGLI family protein [Chryseobacterium caseinilyticum]